MIDSFSLKALLHGKEEEKEQQLGLDCEVIAATHGWDFHITRRGVVFLINTGSAMRYYVTL